METPLQTHAVKQTLRDDPHAAKAFCLKKKEAEAVLLRSLHKSSDHWRMGRVYFVKDRQRGEGTRGGIEILSSVFCADLGIHLT